MQNSTSWTSWKTVLAEMLFLEMYDCSLFAYFGTEPKVQTKFKVQNEPPCK